MLTLASNEILATVLASIVLGYGGFWVLVKYLPTKLGGENELQRKLILQEAETKAESIRLEEATLTEQFIAESTDELEAEIEDKKNDLELREQHIAAREEEVDEEIKKYDQRKSDFLSKHEHVETFIQKLESSKAAYNQILDQYKSSLAKKASLEVKDVTDQVKKEIIDSKKVELNQSLKAFIESISGQQSRLAQRLLTRANGRYNPFFVWPKGVGFVEIENTKLYEQIKNETEESGLIAQLRELGEGINIRLEEPERNKPLLRFAGGYGIYKEASMLTFEEISKNPSLIRQMPEIYKKHKELLENHALELGQQAARDLQLQNMHTEILKMVGALNWRTSYRQNQYFHSVEVAKLAGLIASEIGIDPDKAKRCGLLHDIGKGIDYRIEGSHAVISGDYADRFGESKEICDAVMAHHADLIVETPLAYTLMAADTLSGARPGARVNLEEGYRDRLASIEDVIYSFKGVSKMAIMNGAREVHIDLDYTKVREDELEALSKAIARKIEEEVAFPGQIKVQLFRKFEVSAVA